MTIEQAFTYYDDDENEDFVFDDFTFDEVADFIRSFIELDDEAYEGEDIEAVAEAMADGRRPIPDYLGAEMNEYYFERAMRWRREPKWDDFDL